MADLFTKQKADFLAGSAGAFTACVQRGLWTEELAPLVAGGALGESADLSPMLPRSSSPPKSLRPVARWAVTTV